MLITSVTVGLSEDRTGTPWRQDPQNRAEAAKLFHDLLEVEAEKKAKKEDRLDLADVLEGALKRARSRLEAAKS